MRKFAPKKLLVALMVLPLSFLFISCNQKELESAQQKVELLQKSLDSLKNDHATLVRNEKLVTDFYNLAYNTKNIGVIDQYIHANFIEHNPQGKNGTEELKRFLEFLYKLYPESMVEIKRVVANKDLVVIHSLKKMIPKDRGAAVVEIFKVENGKITEHWDVSQSIPANSSNKNGIF